MSLMIVSPCQFDVNAEEACKYMVCFQPLPRTKFSYVGCLCLSCPLRLATGRKVPTLNPTQSLLLPCANQSYGNSGGGVVPFSLSSHQILSKKCTHLFNCYSWNNKSALHIYAEMMYIVDTLYVEKLYNVCQEYEWIGKKKPGKSKAPKQKIKKRNELEKGAFVLSLIQAEIC